MPKTITFDRFEIGIDRRKGPNVADANRLRDCRNAYVTPGWAVQKRPGLVKVADLEAGTVGLVSGGGKLNTFYSSGSITHAHSLFEAHQLDHPNNVQIRRIHKGFVFNGYLYVAAEYVDGSRYHHYLDGADPTRITDSNCPHSLSIEKLASKLFAVDGDVVRYSKTNDVRDWSEAGDAGFLATGLQAAGDDDCKAVGNYQGDLVAFFVDSAQVWEVDPDPLNMAFRQSVDVGTRFPASVANLAGDVFFRGDHGYRSISLLALTNNLADVDVGSAIDDLVLARATPTDPMALYFAGGGQYLCANDDGIVDVYSFSRTAKISAWSYYAYGTPWDAIANHDGRLYVRIGDAVYRMDRNGYTDDGELYECIVEFPLLDFKKPGVEKQILGMDLAMEGECEVAFKYQYVDGAGTQEAMTDWQAVSGATHSGRVVPVEMVAQAVAPVFRARHDQPWRLDSFSFYYELLGPL